MLNHSGSVLQVPIVFIISFLILLFLIPVQAVPPTQYYEIDSDVELRGAIFVDVDPSSFYGSLIDGVIQIDSSVNFENVTVRFKGIALGSRLKKYNGFNVGYTHIADNGTRTYEIKPLEIDFRGFAYLTTDFSTVIINGMTGTTTTTLTGLSGNQSISVPNGLSYDLNITNNQSTALATGGNITYYANDTIHTFETNGYFNASGSFNLSVLVVAGGGGGGGSRGAGAGAGGYQYNSSFGVSLQEYSIIVGAGGIGVSGDGGTNGGNSTFSTIISLGGAGGAIYTDATVLSGGSGGGGTKNHVAGGLGTAGQGYNGGEGSVSFCGGGGGASEVGYDAVVSASGGDGGDGLSSSISGAPIYYGGGGGAGVITGAYTAGLGGLGGGGGGVQSGVGGAGSANTGGGGGGAGDSNVGGSGGSGIVIIRYIQSVGVVNITASVTGDSNEQSYNTSQSREFTLTPTGTTNTVLINTTSTDYDVTVTTYWTENTTLQSETATAGYAKQYINYTPSFNITSADLNTTFTFNLSAQDYIGAATSTLNDVSKTTTKDGQDVNASVGSLTESTPYWWNVTVPYNNIFSLSVQSDITAFLGVLKQFNDSIYSDPEGLSVDSRLWTFGDGDTSSSSNPSHTYASLGEFNANYSVTETATVSPQIIVREFNVSVEVQPPQNITTVPYQTYVSINWDDYAYADKYSVYELEDGFSYIDTNPTMDGVKDAIYDYAHKFLIFSPNPVNTADYETIYPLRTSLGAYFLIESVDNDNKLGDDDTIYYFRLGNGSLAVNDPAWKITDNNVKKYLWDGNSWQITGTSNAVGASTGSGTHYPIHELFIPIAELGGNWTNGSTVKVLVKREDSSLSPDVVTWYPYGNINNTDTALWQEMVLNQPNTYNLLANVTLSNYTATNLIPFTIYHGAVSAWNGSMESSYTLFDVITEDLPVYNASGYVLDIDGNPITDATIYSCNGFVHEITQTDIYGYWIGYNFRNDTYTICANATGYVSNSTSITVAGVNLTNINITLIAEEIITVSKYQKIGEMFIAIPTILKLVFQKIADVIPIIVVLIFIMLIINVIGVAIHAIRVWR